MPPPSPRDFVTVVSGLPRSGTSLVMQMLAAGGLPPLTDGQRAADASNPRGYWEYEPVKQLGADASVGARLADAARGRAVKVIHLLLPLLPTDGAAPAYRVVFLRRPLAEVIASQRAMLARLGKPGAAGLDDARLAAAFYAQLDRADAWLVAHADRFRVCDLSHRDLLDDSVREAQRLNDFLGGGLDAGAMARAVDPALWRQRLPTARL